MKLEDGKTYLTRGGDVVGPLWSEPDSEREHGTAYFSNQRVDNYLTVWLEDGTADFFGMGFESDPDWDIVEELVENT
jgi:hypothetical protein